MKRQTLTAACAALTFLVPSASAADGDGIINGTQATQGEYPAQGALLIDLDPDLAFACGGTLVGRRHFLTAAHCVDGVDPSDLRVRLGSVDLTAGVDLNVASVDVHENFDGDAMVNDLAMLTLASPATFDPLRVVRANETSLWAAGTSATVIGWGETESEPFSPVLLETRVPIIGDGECTSQYGSDFDPATMVCAYDGVHDTCRGDSGGPLMVPNPAGGFVLAGVTSWGPIPCAATGFAGVYARLGGALNQWVMARHPWATFGVPSGLHSGLATTLTQSSFHPEPGSAFTSFNWDLDGDGQYDDRSGPSVSATFPRGGGQSVGLEASNAAGDRALSRQSVSVNWRPSATAGGPYTIREGAAATLRGGGSDPEQQALTFGWDLDNNGSFEAPGQSRRFVGLDGLTRRTVGFRVCDSVGGCTTVRTQVRITNVRPRANAGPDRRTKQRKRLRFRVRITDPGKRDRHRITWRWGDGRRSTTGRTAFHAWRRPGTYIVRVTVKDDDGALGTDTVRVRVTR